MKNSNYVLYLDNKDELVKWDLFAILLQLKITALSRFDFGPNGQILQLKCSLGGTYWGSPGALARFWDG